MPNPGVSDISVGGCGEVGLQKLKLSLKLLMILLFRLSFLVRMFSEVLIDFRVEGGEDSEHTLGDHRILDFCEPKVKLLFPESRFNSFGWLQILIFMLDVRYWLLLSCDQFLSAPWRYIEGTLDLTFLVCCFHPQKIYF